MTKDEPVEAGMTSFVERTSGPEEAAGLTSLDSESA